MRKKICVLVSVLACMLCAVSVSAQERLRLATTTSADNSGLLQVLLPPFEQKTGIKVDVIAVGSGKAFAIGRNCDVDVLLVHSPADEERFVKGGFGVDRRPVMVNDFVIVGPPADPAAISELSDAAEALQRIAAAGKAFVSRGDESGTHVKEKQLWAAAGSAPAGAWYREVGQGMGAVLKLADEIGAYTLSDRGTYLAMKDKLKLQVLSEHDQRLQNPYSVIAINPAHCPRTNYARALQLVEWLTSARGQAIIRDFGKDRYGEPLFTPTAKPVAH
jgi:tungstate transport system substrate-binding protein